jgi:PPOX class probable F420-dependent enzyme
VSSHSSTTASGSRPDAARSGYFASLAPARHMLLTTFKEDGTSASAPARVVVDGDRAYFRAWSWSGASKRLQRIDWVEVAPCTVLGLCRYGPALDATARLLTGEEASRAAAKLAGRYPVQRRFLVPLLHRVPGWQTAYYELRADEAA